jgi:hypothetical protein
MYEALLAAGNQNWRVGDKVRVYRARGGWTLHDEDTDPRDYDVEHYVRALRANYASRLARALTAEDFLTLFADPDQPSLFPSDFASMRAVLTRFESSPGPSPSTQN